MTNKPTQKMNMHLNKHIIKYVKNQFSKISKRDIIKLIKKIEISELNIDQYVYVDDLGFSEYKINRNKLRFEQVDDKNVLNNKFRKELFEDMIDILHQTQSVKIVDIDDENEDESWVNKNTDGKYEVNNYTTYDKINKFTQDNGDDTDFLYRFSKKNGVDIYSEEDELQVIELDILSNAQSTSIPIEFFYDCYKCRQRNDITTYTRKPYEVASSYGNKINCTNSIEGVDGKPKMCGALLEPISIKQKTKEILIYDGVANTMIDDEMVRKKFKVMSFKNVPVGPLTAAVVKIPNSFGEHMIFLLDYKIEKQNEVQLKIDEKKHNIFNLINNIDNYIKNVEGYHHYGYLPMKIAALLQYTASIFPSIGRNYHIALTGGASTGKTAFSQYWGSVLYGNKLLDIANVSDISIPSLRGSVETIHIFNNKVQQRTDGHLNTKELIVINELSSDILMKKSLKGHLFNSEYTFSKVGGDTIPRTRNAQFIITENINPEHVGRYKNTVRKFYESEECRLVNEEIIKPSWNDNWDLELPITHSEYADKPHLRLAIYLVRKRLENENKNWIDGDEIASDDRFLFYFFVSNTTSNERMTKTILSNESNIKKSPKTSELIRRLHTSTFRDFIEQNKKYLDCEVTNDKEYLKELYNIIIKYDPKASIRFWKMFAGILKMLRVIDGRDYYKSEDLNIIKYIIENVKSKIEISETDQFEISGYQEIDIPEKAQDYFGTSGFL